MSTISAPFKAQRAYSRNYLRNRNTGIKMKNHKSIHTNLRTNSQTKSSLIPESLFIRYPKQITNITYNIGNNSFYLSTPIQRTHNPISNKISERTVNCNFEINIPDTKIYIYQITIVFKNQTSLPRHIIDHRNSVPNIIKETNHRITY